MSGKGVGTEGGWVARRPSKAEGLRQPLLSWYRVRPQSRANTRAWGGGHVRRAEFVHQVSTPLIRSRLWLDATVTTGAHRQWETDMYRVASMVARTVT